MIFVTKVITFMHMHSSVIIIGTLEFYYLVHILEKRQRAEKTRRQVCHMIIR